MRYLPRHICHKNSARQAGFTLLELMIALAIFAVMAMMGWQIMDALSKSRDRAKAKIATLRTLQYAYESLSQDLAQTDNAIALPPITMTSGNSLASINTANIVPSFSLNAQGISFVRSALPDPRFTSSPTFSRIGYSIVDNQLIKTKFDSLLPNRRDNATTSVLLTDVTDAKWTALTPNAVNTFPDSRSLQASRLPASLTANNPINNSPQNATVAKPSVDLTAYQQLPKGIEVQFTYQQIPIVWRFALPAGSPTNTGLIANLTGSK